jgi:hypothetical protein
MKIESGPSRKYHITQHRELETHETDRLEPLDSYMYIYTQLRR